MSTHRFVFQRINIYSTPELEYWARQFNTSTARILQAVAAVGPAPEDVGRYLQESVVLRRPHPRRLVQVGKQERSPERVQERPADERGPRRSGGYLRSGLRTRGGRSSRRGTP